MKLNAIVRGVLAVGVLAGRVGAQPAPQLPPPAASPPPAAPPSASAQPTSAQPASAPSAAPPAEAPAVPAPSATAPPAAASPTASPAAAAPAPEAGSREPSQLEVGSGGGFFQPGALLQFWLVASRQNQTPEGETAPVADEQTFGFRLRRAELRVKGEVVPKLVAYQVMIDPARAIEPRNVEASSSTGTVKVVQSQGALTILQDVFITFTTDYVDVSVGQFKIPVSMDGYSSSSKLLFPERAPVSRAFGDRRDIGIRLEKKLGDYFGYTAGVFNGSGQNVPDSDTEKDLALRLEGYPIKGATIAGVGYATVGKRKKASKDRLELDLKYDAHSVYAMAEFIRGWDSTNGQKAVEGQGAYVQAGYTFFDHLQPMLRFGDLDPDVNQSGDHYWHYEGGVAWLIQKYEAKVTLAVAYYDPTHPNPPKNPEKLEGTLAVQAGF
jgi:hypothetical protein